MLGQAQVVEFYRVVYVFVPIHICTSTDKFHILANIWQIKDVLYIIKDDLEKLNLKLFSLA